MLKMYAKRYHKPKLYSYDFLSRFLSLSLEQRLTDVSIPCVAEVRGFSSSIKLWPATTNCPLIAGTKGTVHVGDLPISPKRTWPKQRRKKEKLRVRQFASFQ
jgi:hypothetical protein